MLRHFFSYVPSGPPPEEPEIEPPDPNANRALSEPFRAARRTLVAVCAVSVAWSTAQFGLGKLTFDAVGVTIDLENASVPLLLAAGLLYLTTRWVVEFAMMPRQVRRWPLAQLDFRIVFFLARFSFLALAAAALQRSLASVGIVVASVFGIICVSGLLSGLSMFVTVPIRFWARDRAGAPSAANAAVEAYAWAVVFGVILTIAGSVTLGIASYQVEWLRLWLWPIPPNPIALATFVTTLDAVFLSQWLFIPVTRKLFAQRPGYRTSRGPNGEFRLTTVDEDREPLL